MGMSEQFCMSERCGNCGVGVDKEPSVLCDECEGPDLTPEVERLTRDNLRFRKETNDADLAALDVEQERDRLTQRCVLLEAEREGKSHALFVADILHKKDQARVAELEAQLDRVSAAAETCFGCEPPKSCVQCLAGGESPALNALLAQTRREERERCAKVAENVLGFTDYTVPHPADLIRKRIRSLPD